VSGTLSNVTFTGYLGDKYLDTLASFDALLFLVPGSDGTCRAIREAMCMGRAVIGARRGLIPEIVEDGKTGIVIDDTPETIARAIERLAADRAACAAMGEAGRRKALERWARDVGWERLCNRAGTTFRKLPEADTRDLTEARALDLMVAKPSMIKRPVLTIGSGRDERILVGFSPDAYAEALGAAR
jgi:arsenate reductase-like glutaredoxin family protein